MKVIASFRTDHPFTRPTITQHYFRARNTKGIGGAGQFISKHTNAQTGMVQIREYANKAEWLIAREIARMAVGFIHRKSKKAVNGCECHYHLPAVKIA